MQGIGSLNTANASTYLGRLFKDAAGVTDAEGKGLKDKGLQITEGKITLKGPEVDQLLSHVGKLAGADKADALRVLDFFRDKFEIPDAGAKKKLLDFVPKSQTPLEAPGRVRTVADAKAEAATGPSVISKKDIEGADQLVDKMKETIGKDTPGADVFAADAHQAKNTPIQEGKAKANPEDGGRKAYVESQAKAPPKNDPFAKYANSPWFEDRLMAALGRNSIKFMNEMNQKMGDFDDPQKEESLRTSMKANVKELMKQADRISPEGKARVAGQIVEFAKANPGFADNSPELKQFVDLANKASAAPGGKDDILKNFPSADDKVLAAMDASDHKEVRDWSAVFKAAKQAEGIKTMLGSADVSSMSEEDVRKLDSQAHAFQASLAGMKQMLPKDVADGIPDVKLTALPPQVDGQSRQVQMQQINMMMQQYQQIMQAMSEIMNKMNEMAMDPIRKMGR